MGTPLSFSSGLYECEVAHERLSPKRHGFRYRLFLLDLDLDELPALHAGLRLFSHRRFNLYCFRDSDHLNTGQGPDLRENLRFWLEERGIPLTGGQRVRLITLPRILGYIFNPVCFYIIHDLAGQPSQVVVEVHNTFHELKPYLIAKPRAPGFFRLTTPKLFYVSPFSSLTAEFDFRVRVPDSEIEIHIDDLENGRATLVSWIRGTRQSLTDARLFWYLLRFPLLTFRIIAGIHWQALRLWLKRLPFIRKADQPELQSRVAAATLQPESASPRFPAMSLTESTVAADGPRSGSAREPSFLTRVLRGPLLKTLRGFRLGRLQVDMPDGTTEFFGGDRPGPAARLSILRDDFFKKCALHGNVGLGEAYMDGDWDTPDIRAVIEWFILNLHADTRARGSSQRLRLIGILRILDRIGHRLRPNSRTVSRRNIEEHYDLGNDFYRLWLDPGMTYSAARFTSADQSLEDAQREKYEALCDKLRLTAADHVLEIGCGWGGFALHAAGRYGCRVTGVTISPAQHEEALRRVREAGLEDRVDIRLQDYRDLSGRFDKIVSIEMLEAVGDRYLETWCSKCHEVLAPGGLLAVQMITVPDCDHAELRRGADFIQKHIFPGSLLLSVGRMNHAMNRTGNLFLHGLEDLGSSYARTLREWHRAFNARAGEVAALGFSPRFIRKWNYYLNYCEAAFATRNISVVQAVYTRPVNHLTLHREDGVIL